MPFDRESMSCMKVDNISLRHLVTECSIFFVHLILSGFLVSVFGTCGRFLHLLGWFLGGCLFDVRAVERRIAYDGSLGVC